MDGVTVCLSIMVIVLLYELIRVRKALVITNRNQVRIWMVLTGQKEEKDSETSIL